MRSLALLVVLLMIAPAIRWVGETPGDDGTGERGAEVIAGHPGDRTVGPGRVVGTQAPPGRDGGGHSTDRSPAMSDDPGRSGPPASDGERDRGGAPEPVYLRRGNPGTGIDFRGPGLYIIQFEPGADALPRLERAGAVLYDRIPRHARVAWLESVPGTEGIVRLFPLTPEIKVLSTGPVCRIAPTDLVRTSADLAGLGIDADRVGPYLRAGLTPAQVRAVAA
ncbi:MAG TPA: hypothetical protein EYP43_02945, partial [Thermoplasmata archaeon]|nr:hypothetical protein [Thermoplasmata archaeon]